jgi:hypothetical protein
MENMQIIHKTNTDIVQNSSEKIKICKKWQKKQLKRQKSAKK